MHWGCIQSFTFINLCQIEAGSLLCVHPQTPNEDAGVEAIKDAVNLGINFFDTAPFYGSGSAEKVLQDKPVACLMHCPSTPRVSDSTGVTGNDVLCRSCWAGL